MTKTSFAILVLLLMMFSETSGFLVGKLVYQDTQDRCVGCVTSATLTEMATSINPIPFCK